MWGPPHFKQANHWHSIQLRHYALSRDVSLDHVCPKGRKAILKSLCGPPKAGAQPAGVQRSKRGVRLRSPALCHSLGRAATGSSPFLSLLPTGTITKKGTCVRTVSALHKVTMATLFQPSPSSNKRERNWWAFLWIAPAVLRAGPFFSLSPHQHHHPQFPKCRLHAFCGPEKLSTDFHQPLDA